jgi:2-methylcitrate dehydratase PrpD
MNESLILAKNIADICYTDLSDHAVQVAKRSLLDALGVTFAAGTLGEGCKQFVDLAVAEESKPKSTIIGFGVKVSATMAAFANGAMAHALDFEDAYDGAPVHPNAATIPAALAVAESIGNVGGKEFLTAIILGSDLVCRLGLALNVNPLEYGWYIPPILGAFGATAAASKLLNLTTEQIVDALSLALCQATCSGELTHSPRSVVRSIRDAFSAKAGVLSALLAKQGITGFDQPIEGKAGLFSLYTRGNYDSARLTSGLGEIFESANVSFKLWPSCRGTHAYIGATLAILAEHRIDPGNVKKIQVVVNPVNKMLCEPLESKRRPVTAIDAKFSIPFVIATTLVHGSVTLEHFAPPALSDPTVLELARRVVYQVDQDGLLKNTTQGSLQIVTQGETFSARVDFALGHPNNPISQDALVGKFMDCAKHSARRISERQLDEIVELVLNLEHVDNIGEITARL